MSAYETTVVRYELEEVEAGTADDPIVLSIAETDAEDASGSTD